jgi:hypothetical protein
MPAMVLFAHMLQAWLAFPPYTEQQIRGVDGPQ